MVNEGYRGEFHIAASRWAEILSGAWTATRLRWTHFEVSSVSTLRGLPSCSQTTIYACCGNELRYRSIRIRSYRVFSSRGAYISPIARSDMRMSRASRLLLFKTALSPEPEKLRCIKPQALSAHALWFSRTRNRWPGEPGCNTARNHSAAYGAS